MTPESFCFLLHDAVSLNQHQEDKALSAVNCCLPFSQSILVGREYLHSCQTVTLAVLQPATLQQYAGSTAQVVVSLLAKGDGLLFGVWKRRNSHHSALCIPLHVAKPEPESAKPHSQAWESKHSSMVVAKTGQHDVCF